LGLSIVARIAELHGAALSLEDGSAGQGLSATLRFPGN
jgi:two-component system sensor histidine kinase QseC